MRANQLILLKPDQLEALAAELERAAAEIRAALVHNDAKPIWISDIQHVETILESTDHLLRELDRALENSQRENSVGLPKRIGRPRRTRRRNP